jgi:hypothetical protein
MIAGLREQNGCCPGKYPCFCSNGTKLLKLVTDDWNVFRRQSFYKQKMERSCIKGQSCRWGRFSMQLRVEV